MSYLYFYTQGDEDNIPVNEGSVSSSHQINPLDQLNMLQEVLKMSESNKYNGSTKGSIDNKVAEAFVFVKRGFITTHIIDTNYILLFLLLFCMYRA